MLKRYFGNNKTFLSVVTSFIMILAGLSACAGQNSAPTFTDSNPITIGMSLSSTGDFTSDGIAFQQGYQLWADQVNNSGGLLGRQVKLVILHDDSTPAMAQKNYETLIKEHVDLLFGPFSSLLTKAAMGLDSPTPGMSHYAFIEGAGGAGSVFVLANKDKVNVFDVSLPVDNNLITFAYYLLSLPQDQRPKTAAYLTSNDPFTQPQVDLARGLLEQGGVRTAYYDAYDEQSATAATTKQVTPLARKVAQTNADVDIFGSLLPDIQTEISVFKQMHYNPKAIIGTAGPGDGQDFIKAVGGLKYANGVFVPNGWYPQANNFQNAEMVQAYLAQYGGTADQINADVAEAFSVGQVLQQAVEKIGSIDNTKLIAELQSGEPFNTVQGTASFDPPTKSDVGQNTQAIAYLFQWQGNQFIPVYPYSVAAENPAYPKPPNF